MLTSASNSISHSSKCISGVIYPKLKKHENIDGDKNYIAYSLPTEQLPSVEKANINAWV